MLEVDEHVDVSLLFWSRARDEGSKSKIRAANGGEMAKRKDSLSELIAQRFTELDDERPRIALMRTGQSIEDELDELDEAEENDSEEE